MCVCVCVCVCARARACTCACIEGHVVTDQESMKMQSSFYKNLLSFIVLWNQSTVINNPFTAF